VVRTPDQWIGAEATNPANANHGVTKVETNINNKETLNSLEHMFDITSMHSSGPPIDSHALWLSADNFYRWQFQSARSDTLNPTLKTNNKVA
jgi:hypothetical protein